MRRVVVYGNGGSGKSTLARALATALGGEAIEIDAIAFDGDYQHVEPTVLRARFESALASDRWVVEGMHRDELSVALEKADTFVWLDLPRHTVARRLIGRVLHQLVSKRERHGRRTTFASLRHREVPFIRKTLVNHERRRHHGRAFTDLASLQGAAVIHLTSATKAERWLRQAQARR
ncbi:MAG TPA: AAA family ATPase [Acidimicrobiales bacterium]|nr:AAA family ATPase [Acidimicrobiales bacterium]